MTKLISKYALNPVAGTYKRLQNKAYDKLIKDINQHFIENKDRGGTKIIFGCRELISENFPNHLIFKFDNEEICDTTAERFKKQLKKGDYKFNVYNSKYQYFYHDFTIEWL